MNVQLQLDTALALAETMRSIVGADQVLTGEAMVPFITDVYRARCSPAAVVRPGSVAELQAAVGAASAAGAAVFVRGGGASYTDGYLPNRPDSILIDMGRLNRIVEINEHDCYVTVEAGVTWKTLKDALDPLELRTPFFGPFSGIAATIGGCDVTAFDQPWLGHAWNQRPVGDRDGCRARLGRLAIHGLRGRGSAPFCRWYGPDLAGLFCGDCGVLGVKARITLPLLRRPMRSNACPLRFRACLRSRQPSRGVARMPGR